MPVFVDLAYARFVHVDAETRALRHRQIAADGGQRFLVGAEAQQIVSTGIVVDAEANLLDRMGRPELTRLYAVAFELAGRDATEIDGEQAFLAGSKRIVELIDERS